ncbi:flap endonuclease [Spongiibacter sp. KMU-166]|uniref:Flap endonuclease n=1 Tax=Spongiibacter thalassae TaxID=2721624 RepID=A0ABX1GDN5_9GAMM|nr:5'-3' exonuclease H3TH domain-containing protein [Spongiibacter thalassae]NKI17290.1 flap endonuclease [Spongiibacter thalassae]
MTAPRLYCLDASIYIFRAYFSRSSDFVSPEGFGLNAVEGFIDTVLSLLRQRKPDHLMAAFDESLGSGFREALYPEYKSRRALPDEALAFQLACCRRVAELLGIPCFSSAEFEADDLIASAAAVAQNMDWPVTVISRDKDLAQVLTGDSDELWHIGEPPRSRALWQQERQLDCARLADYLAVLGDASDDIPGLKGVGEKTAKAIFQRFSSLEDIYGQLDQLALLPVRGAATLAAKFASQRSEVFLYRELTRLRRDVAVAGCPEELARRPVDSEGLRAFCLEVGFSRDYQQRLLRRCAQISAE